MADPLAQQLASLVGGTDAPSHTWVSGYAGNRDEPPHQFVLFLKPEVTAVSQGVSVKDVLDLILATLRAWRVEVGGARVLRGDYLREHLIMDRHYGVINSISHRGADAITPAAATQLDAMFGSSIRDGTRVLGGHQFLEQEPYFSPLALSVLSDNLGTVKLGGGTYALTVNVQGRQVIVLNPFHPFQLEPYYAPDSAIIVLACLAAQPWAELRQRLAGATDPLHAAAGSLRNLFLTQKERLGLADVSRGANGIHLSAGPLEGMVEVQRFFSDHESGLEVPAADTAFGRRLARNGMDQARILQLAGNPNLAFDGREVSAFDLTEEMDAVPAAAALRESVLAG